MTITIERARELLPPEYGEISDKEIQHILDWMYFVCDFAEKRQREHPWESLGKEKPKEPEAKLNKERHQTNKMPMKANIDQKIKWHIEHVAHCKCRPMPDKIRKEIEKRIRK